MLELCVSLEPFAQLDLALGTIGTEISADVIVFAALR